MAEDKEVVPRIVAASMSAVTHGAYTEGNPNIILGQMLEDTHVAVTLAALEEGLSIEHDAPEIIRRKKVATEYVIGEYERVCSEAAAKLAAELAAYKPPKADAE